MEYKYLRIYKKELGEIVRIGLPTGIQSSLFSISNILIQSTINTFGEIAIEGNGGAAQLDAFVYTVGNAVANASMSFVSQNVGARDIKRVKKVLLTSVITLACLQFAVGLLVFLFSKPLLSLFVESQGAYYFGGQRLIIQALFYFLCGIMEVYQLAMRAMGKSTISMILTLFFACAFRIIWLKSFYLLNPTFIMIFISYPVSWALNIIAHLFLIIPLIKKLSKEFSRKKEQTEQVEKQEGQIA